VTGDPGVDHALDAVGKLYTQGLSEHGVASKAVGWKDEESQLLRFEQLARVLDDEGPVTVNDWGCGYGAMFGFLDRRLGRRLGRYVGYDISAEMIEAARSGIADERATFVLGSKVEPADYSFVSGTFNVKFETPEEEWRAWVEDRVRELAAASTRGLAFNLLSTYVDWQEDHLFYADPRHFFDFCKRELSPRVALLHDYPLYEWTILVRL
jgi:SAM-dependent methyltransferase